MGSIAFYRQPPTDIAAVLTVIKRREEANRDREKENGWRFSLRGADLRGADLWEAHFEDAILQQAHLEGAILRKAMGLKEEQLELAHGNANTRLPEDVARPAHWPPEACEEDPD